MMKKFFLFGFIISFVLSMHSYSFAAADSHPAIMLNSTKIEATANIDGENIYLPLRAVGEALGYEIEWSGKDNTVSVFRSDEDIMIDLNNNQITANNHTYYVGNCKIIGDRTYLGADFFTENFGLEVRLDGQNGIIQLESIKENAISIKTVREASETDNLTITLQYPQIDGLADKTVQDSINSIFKKSAEDARNQGLENEAQMEKDIALGYTGSKCGTYFDYRLKYNQNGLLSIVFLNYQYTGGAHGLTVQSSCAINLKTGQDYKLMDLVKSDADYVAFISNAVKNEIDARVKEGILPDYSLAPFEAIRQDQDFYLSGNAVVVYFQQYEYFPYAAGIQEFPIEFSALKDILKPDFNFLSNE